MTGLRDLAGEMLPALLSHLWSSTIFLVLILVIAMAGRNHLTASGRFVLALIGILKFAIPASLVTGALERFTQSSSVTIAAPFQALGGALTLEPVGMSPSVWPTLVIVLWLTVAAALMVRLALTRHRLAALAVRTALSPAAREVRALQNARRRTGVTRSIDIARAAFPEAPAVLRVFRPLIVLPLDGCEDLSEEELEALLCHECAHVARRDNLMARIESFICALFWFHPLIWIAQRITVIERERACDEVVSGSADERDTYLTALTKFCHAAIAPRLPGVSCMATARLKERMDYVMNYAELKSQAPSSKRLTLLGSAGLVLFTLAAGIAGSGPALALANNELYAVRVDASRTGQLVTLQGSVFENSTQRLIAEPKMSFEAGQRATSRATAGPLDIIFDVRPDADERVAVHVTIEKNGELVQEHRMVVKAVADNGSPTARKYTGEPLDLVLEKASLRDVIGVFGRITGLDIRIDEAVQGQVSVNWQNVPWDQAFDSLMKENDLTYRLEGKVMHVTKK